MSANSGKPFQFSLRSLAAAVVIVGLGMAAARTFGEDAYPGILGFFGAALGFSVTRRHPQAGTRELEGASICAGFVLGVALGLLFYSPSPNAAIPIAAALYLLFLSFGEAPCPEE